MANEYDELSTSFGVRSPIPYSWMNQIGENFANHEERIGDGETSVVDHEERIGVLEASGPTGARIYVETIAIADALVKTLPTAPVTLIAAPGVGYAIEPLWARIVVNSTGGAYTNIDAAGVLKVEFPSSSWPALAVVPNDAAITNGSATRLSDLIGAATKRRAVLLPQQDAEAVDTWGFVPTIFDLSEAENKALQIRIDNGGSSNLTGGHSYINGMQVTVYYMLVSSVIEGAMPFMPSNIIAPRRRAPRRRTITQNGATS